MSTSAVTPPPGFELERGEHLAVTPPPGFELEDQASKGPIQLPPGFEPENQTSKGSIQLPPGFELEKPAHEKQISSGTVLQSSPNLYAIQRQRNFGVSAQPRHANVRRAAGEQSLSAASRYADGSSMQPEATTQAVERAKEPRPYFDSPEEKFIESTGDFPINFPENLDEFTFPEKEKPSSGASIGPVVRGGWRHPIAWLDELEWDIRHGTGETWPGRILRTMGAKGIESGVSPGVAEMVGGPVVGPVKALRGVLETPTHPVRGINEVVSGTLQAASPVLGVTQPEFLPVATAYSVGSNIAQQGLQKLGVDPEDAEFTVNAVALGGGYIWSARARARAEAVRQHLQDAKVDTLSNEERQAVQRLADALPSAASTAVEPQASQVATRGLPSPGEQVILSNGQRAEVVSVVPKLNRVVLRTRSGLKTVTAANIRWRGPQPAGLENRSGLIAQSSGLTAGSQIEPIQFKAGDYVILANGRGGTVEAVFPEMGVARVKEKNRNVLTVQLSDISRNGQPRERRTATDEVQLQLFSGDKPQSPDRTKLHKNRTPSLDNKSLDHSRTTRHSDGSITYYDHQGRHVTYSKQGFPSFSAYASWRGKVKGLTGRSSDADLSNRQAGFISTPEGYVWHHVEDGETMELVPADVHRIFTHTGGAAPKRRAWRKNVRKNDF